MNSRISVVSTLATSHDLCYYKISSRKGEVLGLVFTESLDAEYPHTRQRLATLFYAFAAA